MKKIITTVLLIAALGGLLMLPACKKQPAEEPVPTDMTVPVSPEQLREKARQEITADNVQDELERLKAEIEAGLEEEEQ